MFVRNAVQSLRTLNQTVHLGGITSSMHCHLHFLYQTSWKRLNFSITETKGFIRTHNKSDKDLEKKKQQQKTPQGEVELVIRLENKSIACFTCHSSVLAFPWSCCSNPAHSSLSQCLFSLRQSAVSSFFLRVHEKNLRVPHLLMPDCGPTFWCCWEPSHS